MIYIIQWINFHVENIIEDNKDIVEDNKYMDWLSKTTFVDSENDENRISKMQEENRILSERVNSQKENLFTKKKTMVLAK